ncbi:MAG: sel1 repeat family protein [Verrucomicrobiaceae bacterium]|nr:sel1 repeat family protein [Verrucomicrobiaceae bacterium]
MHWRLLIAIVMVLGGLSLEVKAQFGQFGDVAGDNLKAEAEDGDAEAQFQYGLRLLTGQGGEKVSKAQGAAWIQKAAKQDHDKAMHILGILYEEGEGLGQDFKKAAEWQLRASEKGLAEAQMRLALLYDQGKGVEKDEAAAAEWAMQAATQGHPPAQALYGLKLVRGDGVPKNSAKAAIWFLRAAQQENGFAQRQLAYLYYTGNGVPVDYARCEAWYRRAAANEEDVWALNDLAWFLATCPEDKYHKGDEAVTIAKAAVKTLQANEGEQRHEMVDTMAAALARSGKFGEAVVWQKRCLSLLKEDAALPPEERTKLQKEFEERLKLYSERKPYIDKPAPPESKGEPLPSDDVLNANPSKRGNGPSPTAPVPGKKKGSVI